VRNYRYRDELLNLAKELGIGNRIQLVELTDGELARYYAAADGYVQPSVEEGFGLAPLEGLSSGNWVIARDVGGIGQFVRESGGGEIVDGSVGSFEGAIARLVASERGYEERRRLHRYVEEKYGWQRVAKYTEDLYSEYV
jgi:glycosyltransferase involved in cell wall biosynthesis